MDIWPTCLRACIHADLLTPCCKSHVGGLSVGNVFTPRECTGYVSKNVGRNRKFYISQKKKPAPVFAAFPFFYLSDPGKSSNPILLDSFYGRWKTLYPLDKMQKYHSPPSCGFDVRVHGRFLCMFFCILYHISEHVMAPGGSIYPH
jgi:hypothetical protein